MNDKSVEYMSALKSPRSITLNDFITLVWLLYRNSGSPSHQWRISPHLLVAGLTLRYPITQHWSLLYSNKANDRFLPLNVYKSLEYDYPHSPTYACVVSQTRVKFKYRNSI